MAAIAQIADAGKATSCCGTTPDGGANDMVQQFVGMQSGRFKLIQQHSK